MEPEVLQEAADASGGAIGGTISPKEISAAVTFARAAVVF
jgi:L-lactate permease